MDEIPKIYESRSSEQVNAKEYFKNYSEIVKGKHNECPVICDVSQLDLKDIKLDQLVEYCSPEHLTIPDEPPKIVAQQGIKVRATAKHIGMKEHLETDLETAKVAKRMKKNKQLMKIVKTYHSRTETVVNYEDELKEEETTVTPFEDFLIYVRVYHPYMKQKLDSSIKVRKQVKFLMQSSIGLLGSQTLDKLRDKITCQADLSISTEVSDNPKKPVGPLAKNVYKSGFFFIENTFYNDLRDPSNRDNSDEIINWAAKRKLGNFKSESMESTRIDSLSVKFGYPWVYQHQGSCEHILVFSDARLVNLNDSLHISSYPKIAQIRMPPYRTCMICAQLPAHWIVTNNDRLPLEPCNFCAKCFKSYNYKDGRKIGNFEAYRFPFDPAVLKPSTSEGKKEIPK